MITINGRNYFSISEASEELALPRHLIVHYIENVDSSLNKEIGFVRYIPKENMDSLADGIHKMQNLNDEANCLKELILQLQFMKSALKTKLSRCEDKHWIEIWKEEIKEIKFEMIEAKKDLREIRDYKRQRRSNESA